MDGMWSEQNIALKSGELSYEFVTLNGSSEL